MAKDDYKEGWGVVDQNGLNLRTITDNRRSAIVKWLEVEAGGLSLAAPQMSRCLMWNIECGGAVVRQVKIYVQ